MKSWFYQHFTLCSRPN